MMRSAAADVRLRNLAHLDRAHNARGNVVTLESILKRKRIHAGSKHADVVCVRAVHALRRTSQTAEDVAAAHRNRELHAVVHDLFDLNSQLFDHFRIDAVALFAHERLARELQEHAFVLVIRVHEDPFL